MKESLIIFDTTLRDGEQSPGASMTREEKKRIALQLERLGVDVIEAGFAAASPGDFASIAEIASIVKESTICSLARAEDSDIDQAAEAIKHAEKKRIHTFIATSPIHMERKLRLTPEQVLEKAVRAVKRARQYTDDVEFSAEDAGRSEIEFLCRVFDAVIQAGATTLNVPDTVGYNMPWQFAETIQTLRERVTNADKVVWSVHCHNDLGLAVANSLAAVQVGARQIECTINGLGERAGNASLEEIVMAVRTRQDVFSCDTRITSEEIVPSSKLISGVTGFPVQPNKAIVGINAFAHEAGIHQDGVLKHRETYEIMRAQDVGWQKNRLVLGKHSGRAAFKNRLAALGCNVEDDQILHELFKRFKNLADKKHDVYDDDLISLFSEVDNQQNSTMSTSALALTDVRVTSEMGKVPVASVGILYKGDTVTAESEGSGPVDAVFKAIEQVAQSGSQLQLYSVNAITTGTDAQGEVTVRLQKNERVVNGTGADTDIIVASAKAYISALSRLQVGPRINAQAGV